MSPSPELIPGGVPLAQIAGLTPSQVGLLDGLWVNTVQDFVGFAGHRATRALLGAALELSESRLELLFQEGQRLVGSRAPDARVMIADIAAADYGTGALLDEPPDELERRQQLPLYTPEPQRFSLPPTADLLHQMPPLREQGSRSTCVPHAVLAMREQLEIAAGAPLDIDLSEQFVYWWCKERDGSPRVPGTYLSVALDCLREAGAPEEHAWPYDQRHRGDEGQGPPPPPVASGDRAYCILRGLEFNRADIAGIKRRIVEGRSVVVTLPVFPSWYHSIASRRWGKVTLPLPAESTDDGHAMPLVGYQDDAGAPGGGYFIARNAWRDWSGECVWKPGYACVPYAYITSYATDLRSAERISASDVYVRDTDLDAGQRDGTPQLFASPDVWLRRQPDGGEEPERAGSGANAVYVRAHTAGPAVAYRVEVEVLEAPLAPYVPAGEWRVLGKQVGDITPHQPAIFPPLTWQPTPEDIPDRCWLVRLHSAVDPLPPLGLLKSNNSAESHQLILQIAPRTPVDLHFMVFSALGRPGEPVLRVERGDLPSNTILSEPSLEPFNASRSGSAAGGLGGFLELLANTAANLRNRGRFTAHMALRLPASTRRGGTYQWGITQWQGETYLGRLSCVVRVT